GEALVVRPPPHVRGGGEQPHLLRQLEVAAARRQQLGERQEPALRLVAAQHAPRLVHLRHPHRHAVGALPVLRQPPRHLVRPERPAPCPTRPTAPSSAGKWWRGRWRRPPPPSVAPPARPPPPPPAPDSCAASPRAEVRASR